MAKFLFVYRNSSEQPPYEPSPEEMQQMMAAWGAWYETVGSGLVDGGDGLLPTGKLVKGGVVSDGPFIEAKELVGGYSIVEADTYEQAAEWAAATPVAASGGSVEVRQLAGYGDAMS